MSQTKKRDVITDSQQARNIRYRHEWKHEISLFDMVVLRGRLSAVMGQDPHAVNGQYLIRSLYFDTPQDKALREKMDGVNRREKFRLRYYNGNTDYIVLEKKSKIDGLCGKEQVPLGLADVEHILAKRVDRLMLHEEPLVRELATKIRLEGLEARTIVDYRREPFVYGPGNVRVTLDYDIRTGRNPGDFLNPDSITIPAGAAPIILEVKWDEYLPDVIRDVVQLKGCHTSSFSKYAACRLSG
ncbi:MAG: polyphosphate polymerase domain-containing protein [Acetatifactor sp.]